VSPLIFWKANLVWDAILMIASSLLTVALVVATDSKYVFSSNGALGNKNIRALLSRRFAFKALCTQGALLSRRFALKVLCSQGALLSRHFALKALRSRFEYKNCLIFVCFQEHFYCCL
jgi:hypothetical protein